MCRGVSAVPVVVVVVVALCVAVQWAPGASGQEQDARRVARGRYKMGYMFGKRDGLQAHKTPAAVLLNSLVRKAISVEDLTRDIQRDATLAQRVAKHLDRNGDGYVSVRELL